MKRRSQLVGAIHFVRFFQLTIWSTWFSSGWSLTGAAGAAVHNNSYKNEVLFTFYDVIKKTNCGTQVIK
jgi:hypothetical protein